MSANNAHQPARRPAAAPDGKETEAALRLSEACMTFLRESSVARGPSLKAQVVMALGQQAGRTQGELLAALEGRVPAELALAGTNGRRGLLLLALGELEAERLIARPGRRDADVPLLTPAPPDARFERDERLRLLLPALSAGALAELEYKLVTEGCTEGLWVWQEPGRLLPLLADGYNRDELFRRHHLPFTLRPLGGLTDRRALEEWVLRAHYARRNLLPDAQSYVRGRQFNALKAGRGGDRRSGRSRGPGLAFAAAEVARTYSLNERTIYRDGRFVEAVDRISATCGPDLGSALLAGTIRLGRGNVRGLARLPPEQMRPLVAQLLAGERLQLGPGRQQQRLVLPLDTPSLKMAEMLLERLGDSAFDRLYHALTVLRRKAQEQAGNRKPVV
jgi:hypothetical protein